MVLEVGPCPVDEVTGWVRFARRILVELKTTPDRERPIAVDLIELWARTLDMWSVAATEASAAQEQFRWSAEFHPDVGEFMLHGLDQCLNSPVVMGWITPKEAATQQPFTMRVVRAFIDGLYTEGNSCRHYVDQVETSLGRYMAD